MQLDQRYGSGFSEANVHATQSRFGLSTKGSNNHTGYKFTEDVVWVREDAGKVDVCVERLDTSAFASISYHTEDGPRGREGINYIAESGRLNFEPGEARKNITIHVVPDDVNYTRARFYVRLYDDSGQPLASATVFVHDSISRTVAAVSFIYDSRIFQTFLGAAIVFSILMPPLQLLYVSKSHDNELQVAYTVLFGLFLFDMLLHSWARWPLGYLFTTGFGMDLLHLAGLATLLDWLIAPIREDRGSMPLDNIYFWEERRFMWGQVARTMKITLLMAQFSDLTFHLAQWVILQKKRASHATHLAIKSTRSKVHAFRLHYGPRSLRWVFLNDRQMPSSDDEDSVISEERRLLARPTRMLLLLVESIVTQVVRLVTLVAVVVVIVTFPTTRLQDRGLLVLATVASSNTTSNSVVDELAGSSIAVLPFADGDNFVPFNAGTTDLVFLKVDGRQINNFTDYARIATLRPWSELRAFGYNTSTSGFIRCNVTISEGIVASVEDDCQSASIYDATTLVHDLARRFLLLAILLIGLSLLGIFFLLLDVLASRISPLLQLLSHARMLRAAVKDMLCEWKKFIREQDAPEEHAMSMDVSGREGQNSPAADNVDAESISDVLSASSRARHSSDATDSADRSQLALARWRLATRAALRSKSTFNAERFLNHLQARYEIIAGRPLRLLTATLQDAQLAFALPIAQQRRHLLHARAYYESKVTPVLYTLAKHLDSGTLTREHLATAAQAVVPRFSFSPAPGSKLSRMLNVASAVVDFIQVNLLAAADSLDRQVRETLKLQESSPVTSSCIESYALILVRPRIRRKLSTVGAHVSPDFNKFDVSQLSREILSAAKQRIAQRLEEFELDVPDWYWESTSSGLAANVERVLVENALRRLEGKGVAVPVEMQRNSRDIGALRQSLEARLCHELKAKLSLHDALPASDGSLGYEDLSWLLINSLQSDDPIAALLLTIKSCLSKGCLPGQIVQRTSVRAKVNSVITTACSNMVQGSRLQKVLQEQLTQKLDAGTLSHVLSQQAEVISMLSEAINEGVSKDSATRACQLLQQMAAIFTVIEEHSLGTTVDATSTHLLNLPFLADWGVPRNPMSTVNIPASFEEVCGNDSALRELLELPVLAEATAVVLFRALVRMGFIVEVGQRLSSSHRFGAFWRSCWQNMW